MKTGLDIEQTLGSPVVLKPKRRGHDTANASIQTTTIMRETLLQELCPVLYWYCTGFTTAVYL